MQVVGKTYANNVVIRGDEAKNSANDQARKTESNADQPLLPVQVLSVERSATELDDEDLANNGDCKHTEENPVSEEALKDIDLCTRVRLCTKGKQLRRTIINLTRVDLIEDLHPHEDVEDDTVVLVTQVLDVKDGGNVKDSQQNTDLPESLASDVLEHLVRDEASMTDIDGQTLEEPRRGLLSGEGERSEGIHDKVHPQQLHGLERRALLGGRADKHRDKCRKVDRKLELQELAHVVEHVATLSTGKSVTHINDRGRHSVPTSQSLQWR